MDLPLDAELPRARVFRTVRDLLADADDFALLAIDIPIGLADAGPRECDRLARKMIAPRSSSVFPAPVRAALDGNGYEEACRLSRAACGTAISKQTFAIIPKIREVDAALRNDDSARERLREVHPEVCFCTWNRGPLSASKKKPAGFVERLKLVEADFPGAFKRVRSAFPRSAVANDDILDAFAALWTAKRVIAGVALTLPNKPPLDRFGLKMGMVV